MISETEDSRVLRRHLDHVRRRHAEPLDMHVGVPHNFPAASFERSEPVENEMLSNTASLPDEEREDIAAQAPSMPSSDKETTSLRRSERPRKAPDK